MAAPQPAGQAEAQYQGYLEVALAAAKEAGEVIAQAWNQPKRVDTKSGEGIAREKDAERLEGGGRSVGRGKLAQDRYVQTKAPAPP